MKKSFVLIILTIIFTSSISFAETPPPIFDSSRQGFFVGFGVGYQATNATIDTYWDDYTIEGDGVGLSFRAGYGINNRTLIFYANETNRIEYVNEIDGPATISLNGIGLSYYFRDDFKSVYITGIIGAVTTDTEYADFSGTGFLIGIGNELTKWVSIQADLLTTDQNYNDGDVGLQTTTVKLSLQFNF